MGRELQKKKNKSSIPRVKHKPKSKRINVRSNAIVAANWDQSLTLSQNYLHLGLTSKLKARSGGIERLASVAGTPNASRLPNDPLSVISRMPTTINPTEARIERDPTTGTVLRIVHTSSKSINPLNDPLNDVSASESEEVKQNSTGHEQRGIIQELEMHSKMEARKRPRQQSAREEEWIASLLQKYGTNFSAMVRDRKLNPYQQNEGDIRRRIERWKTRHG